MADHFYSFANAGNTSRRNRSDITVGSSSVSAATVSTDAATAGTDFDAMADTGVDSLTSLLSGQTYTTATKQLSGTPAASVTLTVAQQQGLITLVNALGAAIVTNISDAAALSAGVSSASPIEVRITDSVLSARQVYDAVEFVAGLAAKRDLQVIAPGTLL